MILILYHVTKSTANSTVTHILAELSQNFIHTVDTDQNYWKLKRKYAKCVS